MKKYQILIRFRKDAEISEMSYVTNDKKDANLFANYYKRKMKSGIYLAVNIIPFTI